MKTYEDKGKSGVVITRRSGLSELLTDVINRKAEYQAILVYDVSRWGRFPNSDEAAHYEFICCSSGIPLHYCAEQFANDGTATSSLLKALKRSMAAEFSRELGEKEVRGKSRLVGLGFWVGGSPGYGYRRLMVSADGKLKQVLKSGQQKSLKTDRVVLVQGPNEEIECVRSMFSMALKGKSCSAIARDLNLRGISHDGRPWSHGGVYNILKNPKYAGINVWNRTSRRLRSMCRTLEPKEWVTKPRAFTAIIDQQIFERVQLVLPGSAACLRSNKEILRRVRRLLKLRGRLSWKVLKQARGVPSLAFIYKRFGSYRNLYERVGYRLPFHLEFASEQLTRSIRLRNELVEKIRKLFPEHITISRLPHRNRSILLVEGQFRVSVLLCSPRLRRGKVSWLVAPNPAENSYITLLCPVKRTHKDVLGYFIFPRLDGFKVHYMTRNDSFLSTGVRLHSLNEFYATVKAARTRKQTIEGSSINRSNLKKAQN